jgi:ABC-type polysaccharide/polyol phosphate export permease
VLSPSPTTPGSAQSARRGQATTYVVTAGAGLGGLRRNIAEAWAFRDVMLAFASRQIRVKYKQAAIGLTWVVIQPLIAALLFTVVLGKLSHVSSEGAPYLLFALCGMVAWGFFSEGLSVGSESVIADAPLLRKVYFPREVLPFAAVFVALVDFLPSFVLLVVFEFAYGRLPTLQWLALPVVPVVLFVGSLTYVLLPAALNVFYRDVRYVLPFIVQIGLFATPVVYSLDEIGQPFRDLFVVFNPAACAIDAVRRIFLHHQWPQVGLTVACLGWSLLLGTVTYYGFKRLERSFADRV